MNKNMSRILISIIFSATAIVIFFVWTNPILKDIQDLKKQSDDFNSVLTSAKEIKSIKEDLVSKYNSVSQESLDKLNKLLPSKVDAIRIIINITDIINRHGLLLKNISSEGVTNGKAASSDSGTDSLQKIPITFTVQGSYKFFLSFLGDLERSLNIIDIGELNFLSSEEDLYEFNVNAVTYWKK